MMISITAFALVIGWTAFLVHDFFKIKKLEQDDFKNEQSLVRVARTKAEEADREAKSKTGVTEP